MEKTKNSSSNKWTSIFTIVVIIFIIFFYMSSQKKYKDFCTGVIEYHPETPGNFGSAEYYASYGSKKFKTYDEATDYCIHQAKENLNI